MGTIIGKCFIHALMNCAVLCWVELGVASGHGAPRQGKIRLQTRSYKIQLRSQFCHLAKCRKVSAASVLLQFVQSTGGVREAAACCEMGVVKVIRENVMKFAETGSRSSRRGRHNGRLISHTRPSVDAISATLHMLFKPCRSPA